MRIIAGVLLVVIITVHANLEDSFEECLTDNGIKPEDYEKLKEKKDPKLHCIMACLFEKVGLLKNGELDRDSAITVLLKYDDKRSKAELTSLVNSCMEKVKDIPDICDITNEFVKCTDRM